MKKSYLILLLIEIVLSNFCLVPYLLNDSNLSFQVLKVIILFPVYFICSQFFLSTILFISAKISGLNIGYINVMMFSKVSDTFKWVPSFPQLVGFSPAAYIIYKDERSAKAFFRYNLFLTAFFLGLLYYFLAYKLRIPVTLFVIQIIVLNVYLQGLYHKRGQELYLLKSKCLSSILYHQNIDIQGEACFMTGVFNEECFYSMIYFSLIKDKLPAEILEVYYDCLEKFIADEGMSNFQLAGLIDILKIDLYLSNDDLHEQEYRYYSYLLDELIGERENFLWVYNGIKQRLTDGRVPDLSWALTDIRVIIDLAYKKSGIKEV